MTFFEKANSMNYRDGREREKYSPALDISKNFVFIK